MKTISQNLIKKGTNIVNSPENFGETKRAKKWTWTRPTNNSQSIKEGNALSFMTVDRISAVLSLIPWSSSQIRGASCKTKPWTTFQILSMGPWFWVNFIFNIPSALFLLYKNISSHGFQQQYSNKTQSSKLIKMHSWEDSLFNTLLKIAL